MPFIKCLKSGDQKTEKKVSIVKGVFKCTKKHRKAVNYINKKDNEKNAQEIKTQRDTLHTQRKKRHRQNRTDTEL